MRRTMIAAALTASLVNPAASTVLNPLWSLWSWLWGGSHVKEGCLIDPWGQSRCSPAPQTGEPEAGCVIDPWGQSQCSPAPEAVESEAGCGIDPWGCPKQGS